MTTTNYIRGQILTADSLNTEFGDSVALAGDIMQGPLTLFRIPQQPMEAAPKEYIDNLIATHIPPGVLSWNSRQGNLTMTPADVSGATGALTTGFIMTGDITLAHDPTATMEPTTKQYVDQRVGSIVGSTVTMSDTAPASPVNGSLWWDTAGGQMYIYYTDPDGSQWVNTTNAGNAIQSDAPADGFYYARQQNAWARAPGEAPNDGNYYSRRNAAWAVPPSPALNPSVQNNAGRNLIHNALFNVQQRGAGAFTTTNTYTADRWGMQFVNDTMTVTAAVIGDTGRAGIGDESAQYSLTTGFTGSVTAGSFSTAFQRIENIHRLAGKTVTISFWAVANSGTPRIGIQLIQNFGTGGSPSASVNVMVGTTVALSTTWARYSFTVALPSSSGKTIGTAGNDHTGLYFYFSDQANTSGTGIGVQTGNVQLWGMQLEVGTVATPLEKLDPADDLRHCQRFYQIGQAVMAGYATAAMQVGQTVGLPVAMRAGPTITLNNPANSNVGTINASILTGLASVWVNTNPPATGQFVINQGFTASADL